MFPESEHVKKLKLENKSDIDIWRYARENNYSILTFDSDYFDLNTLYGTPPKIIWLRTGNFTTKNIEKLLIDRSVIIKQYLSDQLNSGCLQLID